MVTLTRGMDLRRLSQEAERRLAACKTTVLRLKGALKAPAVVGNSLWMFMVRPTWRGIGLGVACGMAAWLLSRAPVLHGVEDWMLDAGFSWRGSRTTSVQIVLVGLDDRSMEALGKPAAFLSPQLAQVVRHLRQQGVASIGIDIFVPERFSLLRDIAEPDGLGDAAPLGQTIRDVGNVVLPRFQTDDAWRMPLFQWRLKHLDPHTRKNTDLGFVNLTEDGDQFVRRQQLLVQDEASIAPSFALALHAVARGEAIRWDDERGELWVGQKRVLLDAHQKMRINYVGPPGTFPVIPFHRLLEEAQRGTPRPELANAVVLIGLADGSGEDAHATPYANRYARWLAVPSPGMMSGMEIHAHALATLADSAYITTPRWLQPLPQLLLFGGLLGAAFARLRLGLGLILALAHHFAWGAAALAALAWMNWRLEVVGMFMLGFLVYSATFGLRWRKLRRMLGVVKSEAVAMALEADPHRLDPGGEERQVSVLFADIRNFTAFSEVHTPREVLTLLNTYFQAVVPLLEAEGGVVNTYMGDGVMVLFGVPASLPDHAARAVRAAVALVRKVHEKPETWAALGCPGFRVGVGVHTGLAIVGAVGSQHRLDYTAIGDTVNAAERIEIENKKLGTELLVSSATYRVLPELERHQMPWASQPQQVHVKGKGEPLLLYPVAVA